VFGVHGVGGFTGTLLTGVFATAAVSASADAAGSSGLLEGNAQQVVIQLYGIGVTIVWSGVVTWVLLKLIGLMVPLRVTSSRKSKASTSPSTARRCNKHDACPDSIPAGFRQRKSRKSPAGPALFSSAFAKFAAGAGCNFGAQQLSTHGAALGSALSGDPRAAAAYAKTIAFAGA
jgi:hypothetical protein